MAAARKFGKGSTATDVVQGLAISSKTFLVTGANSGIGFETARVLATHGAHVVMATRSVASGTEAKDKILLEKSDANVHVIRLDLSDLRTVEQCAETFKQFGWPLHGLILNAGVVSPVSKMTDDGFETTFQINHLGHFYLTQLLTPILKASAPSRVVVVASDAHKMSFIGPQEIKWETLSPTHMLKMPGSWKTYGNSKLCNILFANEFNARHKDDGITANSLHPGMVRTQIQRNSASGKCCFAVSRPLTVPVEKGAATVVYAATAPELDQQGGIYFANCQPASRTQRAMHPESGKRLWALSEEMIDHYKNTIAKQST